MALALVVADSSLPKPIKRLSYTLVHDRSKRHAVICLTFGVMCVATSLAVVSIITVHSEQNPSQKEPLLKERYTCKRILKFLLFLNIKLRAGKFKKSINMILIFHALICKVIILKNWKFQKYFVYFALYPWF